MYNNHIVNKERRKNMKYLGVEFKNKEQLEAWTKAGNIEEYKKLAKLFNNNPSKLGRN